MDVRQVMGAVLTFSMFAMLGNMIKRDHFDADVLLDVPAKSSVEKDVFKISKHSLVQLASEVGKDEDQRLKLCWNNSLLPKGRDDPRGFVSFSLTGGPEYHVSQVANAVLVAKHLGATLVLPDIIGSKGDKRDFEEIYDAEKFVMTMSDVINVEKRKNHETSTQKLITVKVPYNANQNYITKNIEPLFRKTRNLQVITYGKLDKDMNPYSCLATFEALRLKPDLQQVVDLIITRLRSRELNGQFTAIDYKGACQNSESEGMRSCYNAIEITQFLRKIGFQKDTTIYVTQSRRDGTLDALKDSYPNTFTKEEIMEEAEKRKFLDSESTELEQAIIDFHICSLSDVFVPAKSGLFYANVVGNRIAANKTEVFVPAQITSTSTHDHVSSYISKRTHPAYACFC